MDDTGDDMYAVGPYEGRVVCSYDSVGLRAQLGRLPECLQAPSADVIQPGRNRHFHLRMQAGECLLDLAVKSFGRRSWARDRLDRRRGSRAQRSWVAACYLREHGIGTPQPVAYLDRWEKGRLIESYYVDVFLPGARSFKEELIRIFEHEPHSVPLMELIRTVAGAVRAMHDAGFRHNDLGNQNILLRETDGGAGREILFIDLNRSRHGAPLGDRERARDISRIWLPSDFLRAFKDMYFDGPVPPRRFQRWESVYRSQYAIHAGTRRVRHPLRMLRRRQEPARTYPARKDIWIWDDRSGQALIVMLGKEKRRHYPLRRHLSLARSVADVGGIVPEYRRTRRECFQHPVRLEGRIGLAIEPGLETWQRQQALLERLGRIPVLVRCCVHKSRREMEFVAGAVRALHAAGYRVSLSLVQDRRAVTDLNRWRSFVDWALSGMGECVAEVEAAHAINRVKWGIWDFSEYGRLMAATSRVLESFPHIGLMGPAVIDFDPLSTAAALRAMPPGLRLSALSLHLYVDRRGAPENRQGLFSSVDKFAWARAMARRAAGCEDRLVVSEVNWPLKGTGVYSPVGAPYVAPGVRRKDPSVSEDEYASFMVRYMLIATASGMVERLYWWRLVAHGYGLVDDREPACWRERRAYRCLRHLLATLGGATFMGREEEGDCCRFDFETREEKIAIVYSTRGSGSVRVPFRFDWAEDAEGTPVRAKGDGLRVGSAPVYLRGVKPVTS